MILSGGMLLKVLCSMPYSPEKQRAFLHVRKRLLAAHPAGKVRGSGGEVVLSALARTVLRGLAAAGLAAAGVDAVSSGRPRRQSVCEASGWLATPSRRLHIQYGSLFIDKGGFGLLEEDQSANLKP